MSALEGVTVTPEAIGDVLVAIGRRTREELLAVSEEALHARWAFVWDPRATAEWNLYQFHGALERYRRDCRTWEEHHNGNCCVVERVRDKYLLPRFRDMLATLRASDAATAEAVAKACP